jgi:hypothetical protein
VAIDEALKCKRTGEKKIIFFNSSGYGLPDLSAYDEYNHGGLQDLAGGDHFRTLKGSRLDGHQRIPPAAPFRVFVCIPLDSCRAYICMSSS